MLDASPQYRQDFINAYRLATSRFETGPGHDLLERFPADRRQPARTRRSRCAGADRNRRAPQELLFIGTEKNLSPDEAETDDPFFIAIADALREAGYLDS